MVINCITQSRLTTVTKDFKYQRPNTIIFYFSLMSWSGDTVGRGQGKPHAGIQKPRQLLPMNLPPSASLEFSHSAGDRERTGGLSRESSCGPGLSGA